MIKKLIIILLMSVTTILFAQTIAPKKCNTCGKPLVQCQYKGKHPKPNPQPSQKAKPVQQTKPTSGYENGHEWVDLGLSVKWATCNVGASSPNDYGGYYAWGETSIKPRYDYNNCFDCLDSTGDKWGTYKVGGKTQITPTSGHDAARENWGGKWRMPTAAENNELCKKCTWTWTTMNGHKGYRVTGRNGNSIFFPAAGFCYGADSGYVGENGYYWSSSLSFPDTYYASCLYFSTGGYHYTHGDRRRNGQSVRPVLE